MEGPQIPRAQATTFRVRPPAALPLIVADMAGRRPALGAISRTDAHGAADSVHHWGGLLPGLVATMGEDAV